MKWNWGYGIGAFYILFVVVLVFQVWKSTQYDHALVSEHYYQDDINYQQHYNKLVNTRNLDRNLLILEDEARKLIKLHFPIEVGQPAGEVKLFCPSASKEDVTVSIKTDNRGIQLVSTQDLKPGMWRIKVDWEAEGVPYYNEEVVQL